MTEKFNPKNDDWKTHALCAGVPIVEETVCPYI